MIQPQNLRIGNLIERKLMSSEDGKNEWWKIEKIDINTLVWLHSNPNDSDYRYLRLNSEIMSRFGISKRIDGNYNLFKHSEVEIIIPSDFDVWKCDGICFSVGNLEYAHQLQNLFFSLCGEELTFK